MMPIGRPGGIRGILTRVREGDIGLMGSEIMHDDICICATGNPLATRRNRHRFTTWQCDGVELAAIEAHVVDSLAILKEHMGRITIELTLIGDRMIDTINVRILLQVLDARDFRDPWQLQISPGLDRLITTARRDQNHES